MTESDEGLEQPGGGERAARSGTTGAFAAGLLVGALLGASLALLYAPERGSRTRQDLRRRLQRLREEAGEEIERAGGEARRAVRRRRKQLEKRLERTRERLE